MKLTPETVWNSGPGTPVIRPVPRSHGYFDIAIILNGTGYQLADAQNIAVHTASQFTEAGLKARPQLVAEAIKAVPSQTHPGSHVITIRCPYCLQTHTHGVEGLTSNGGHRAPHCHDPEAQQWNKSGYIIYIPEALRQEQL